MTDASENEWQMSVIAKIYSSRIRIKYWN